MQGSPFGLQKGILGVKTIALMAPLHPLAPLRWYSEGSHLLRYLEREFRARGVRRMLPSAQIPEALGKSPELVPYKYMA